MKSNLARKLNTAAAGRPTAREDVRDSRASRVAHSHPTPRTPAAVPPRQVALAITISTLVGINVIGWNYYSAPISVRVRHPLHEWFRPSGMIGQAAGILAFLIFVFLWLYPLRKRFKALAWTGSVGRWLDVHVTAALTLPLLLAIHAAWRFEGVIGLGYTAIMLVCASGVIGRYLYSRIPRARSGVELSLDDVASQRAALVDRIAATTGVERRAVEHTLRPRETGGSSLGLGRSLGHLVAGDVLRWRSVRRLRRRWTELAAAGHRPTSRALDDAVRLASREIALAQHVRFLDATHRVFRWWHVAHRPIAMTALIAVIVHVVVVVAVGATWLR